MSGTLTREIEAADAAKASKKVALLRFPAEVATAAQLMKIAAKGLDFECPRGEGAPIGRLDNYPAGLYGGGVLMSERVAAERVAMAERAATVVALSEREKGIVAELGRRT